MTIRRLHSVGAGATAVGWMRVAVIDEDSGFVQVLRKHLDRAGAECRVLPASTAALDLADKPVNSVVVDPATSGMDPWRSLERLCALEISRDHYQVYAGAACAELTRREFELIELLVGAGGRLIEREDIYARVWGYSMAHGDRSPDVYVRKLRRKLGQISPGWRYIHTHFGVGYRFAAEPIDGGRREPTAEVQAPRRNVA
jgi:DNA-binding response OmpR family regulator